MEYRVILDQTYDDGESEGTDNSATDLVTSMVKRRVYAKRSEQIDIG